MPQINVTERTVSPKLDQGLLTGVIAGGVVSVWMLVIGALGSGAAADFGVSVSALVLGADALSHVGFNLKWLIGEGVALLGFGLTGVMFALVWPRLRRFGTWTPSLAFWLAAYIVLIQILGRILQPAMASRLTSVSLVIGFLIAGLVCAYRYRRG